MAKIADANEINSMIALNLSFTGGSGLIAALMLAIRGPRFKRFRGQGEYVTNGETGHRLANSPGGAYDAGTSPKTPESKRGGG